ncbi:MAG: glucose-6-phosphate isomerase [Gammaproteobacteria bacterium]|nr:glucose-6-phosphate isomerase [Gammaproteobacteria bacterium]
MPSITQSIAWQKLAAHRVHCEGMALPQLFMRDTARAKDFRVLLPGLLVDYSRHLLHRETLTLLLQLAETAGVSGWRRRLFEGESLNNTEGRAALHMLLRTASRDTPAALQEQAAEVTAMLARVCAFAAAVRDGSMRGATGRTISDIINIGIGGSHLGPELVIEALAPIGGSSLRSHFVSNVDPQHVAGILAGVDPARTLVIVTSKTFTTHETRVNAETVRTWLAKALGPQAVAQHFVAVSASPDKARAFGMLAERVFDFREWVGGRYSLWSAVGLPIAIALGPDTFRALLAGAAQMDRHFLEAPPERNAPIILALLGVWYANFFGAQTRAVIPYRHSLQLLPAYLQQLEMESNGKRVRRNGEAVDYATAPVIWGDVGSNAQHAFFQLLHQGTVLVPVDFIAVLRDDTGNQHQQYMLLANCFAQAEALMHGRSETQAQQELTALGVTHARLELLAKHRTFPGNRPSCMLVLDRLDARTLGMLIALYEHRTFVQSCIWDINPFDQMGVELGKQLAGQILQGLEGDAPRMLTDAATRLLVEQALHGDLKR